MVIRSSSLLFSRLRRAMQTPCYLSERVMDHSLECMALIPPERVPRVGANVQARQASCRCEAALSPRRKGVTAHSDPVKLAHLDVGTL